MEYAEVSKIFEGDKGVTFISIDTTGNVSLKGGKSNPFQGRITKKTIGSNVMIASMEEGSAYVNAVRRRMAAEGKDPSTWSPKPRAWGSKIPGTPFVEHNGKYYIEVMPQKSGVTSYFLDGIEIKDPTQVQGFEYPKESEGQGGISEAVIVRSYALENITGIRAHGEEYTS